MELATMIWAVLHLVVLHLRTTMGHHHQHRAGATHTGAPTNGRSILTTLDEVHPIARLGIDMAEMKGFLVPHFRRIDHGADPLLQAIVATMAVLQAVHHLLLHMVMEAEVDTEVDRRLGQALVDLQVLLVVPVAQHLEAVGDTEVDRRLCQALVDLQVFLVVPVAQHLEVEADVPERRHTVAAAAPPNTVAQPIEVVVQPLAAVPQPMEAPNMVSQATATSLLLLKYDRAATEVAVAAEVEAEVPTDERGLAARARLTIDMTTTGKVRASPSHLKLVL
ncbi:hypothetical protein MMC17_002438 [Xylographa soralifera]|nr:hypothetical protein [Xylographa soralifera]